MTSVNKEQRNRRHRRIRAKVRGFAKKPRLCVFRSNAFIYGQLIDDAAGNVLCCARGSKTIQGAEKVGREIARLAGEEKIEKAVFDRGGFKYHGRVKALAEGARAGGLKL